MNVQKQVLQNTLNIGNKYFLYKQKKIGSGAFGEVFLGQNRQNSQLIAIKIEKLKNNLNPN